MSKKSENSNMLEDLVNVGNNENDKNKNDKQNDKQDGSDESDSEDEVYTYVVLQETNGEHFESWYNFIRYEGNEEEIKQLKHQLKKVKFDNVEEYSAFDFDTDVRLSEQTAKEMTRLDLNYVRPHRKYDGKLDKIKFDFRKSDSNRKRMKKVFNKIGNGKIKYYLHDKDSDSERTDDSSMDSDSEYSSDIGSSSVSAKSENIDIDKNDDGKDKSKNKETKRKRENKCKPK